MRTPTPEYDKFCHTDFKNNNDATPMTILRVVFTIAIFDERSKSYDQTIQVASLGVKISVSNTNQYICQPHLPTTEDAANGCKVKNLFSNSHRLWLIDAIFRIN